MEQWFMFFDPSGNGFDVLDLAQVIALVVTVTASTAAVTRWNSKRMAVARAAERERMTEQIKQVVSERTQQIQPNANGGQSLTDLHTKVDQLFHRQGEIKQDVDLLKRAVLQLEDDVEGLL